jgi:dephospho-CoA kinase
MPKAPIYGLTGNMGCGKSTIIKLFNEFPDVEILIADELAKEILCQKQHAKKLQKILGQQVFSNGKINPKKVRQLVFSDQLVLKKLEAFIHPLTWLVIKEKVEIINAVSFFLVEAALLFEANWHKYFKSIIVATCDPCEQFKRINQRDGLLKKEIEQRLAMQLPAEEKTNRADFIIDTTCTFDELKNKVQNLYRHLKGERP